MKQQIQASNHQNIRIANLVSYCQSLQAVIHNSLVEHSLNETEVLISFQEEWVQTLHQQILQQMMRLDRSLERKKANPAHLPLPSYRAFIWLRFLSKEENFLEHLQTLNSYMQLAKDMEIKYRKVLRPRNYHLFVSLSYIPYVYRIQLNGQQLKLTINECLLRAPTGIKKEVLQAALNGNNQSKKMLRSYCSSPGYQGMDLLIRGDKHSRGSSPKGTYANLNESYMRVNRDYFNNELEKPQLAWSQKRNHRQLGSYSAQTDTVIISRAFDQAGVPEYVLDFIMYHELLHKKLGIKKANSGRYNHNKKFKDFEKQFLHYDGANEWLIQFFKKQNDFKYN